MPRPHGSVRRFLPPIVLVFALGGLPVPVQAQQVQINGSMSNFDVHQGSMPVADNFELDFIGDIDASDFTGYFPGWGVPPRFDEMVINGLDQGAEVMWLDRGNAVPFCQWRHFGVYVNPALPPTMVRAWWTKVIKTSQIPVPFQWWRTASGQMFDVLTLSPTFPRPLIVTREFAISPVTIPLEELQFDATPVPMWMPFGTLMLYPGERNEELVIPIQPGMQAYLVRYTVADTETGSIVTRFVTEATLPGGGTTFGPILINFDLVQPNPGLVYDNVELDFFGPWLAPGQVLQWYALENGPGIPAWGVPPLVRSFPAGLFPEMPDRGGIEITWVDKFTPYPIMMPRHFGLVLSPSAMGPLPAQWTWVQAYWTNIQKMPVPVPWQFWQPGPGQTVRDIILYGGDEVGPVSVNRQFVALPQAIPLTDLTWDAVGALPWAPVPGDPVGMLPGGIAELDIPVSGADRAVLVRYTVTPLDGTIETRVINEAVIDVGSSVPEGGGQGMILGARPNPTNGPVEISFRLTEPATARLTVVGVDGRRVASVHEGPLPAGEHTFCWEGRGADGAPAPAGVYFLVLRAGTRTMTQRVVVEGK
jgi:hypothetical protein